MQTQDVTALTESSLDNYLAKRDYVTYSTTITFTAANQVLQAAVQIQKAAAFLWLMMTGTNTDTTSPQVNGGSLLRIEDTGSNRRLNITDTTFADIVGTAQRPYILPTPHKFSASGTIQITATNQGIAAQVVRLTFHGVQLFG